MKAVRAPVRVPEKRRRQSLVRSSWFGQTVSVLFHLGMVLFGGWLFLTVEEDGGKAGKAGNDSNVLTAEIEIEAPPPPLPPVRKIVDQMEPDGPSSNLVTIPGVYEKDESPIDDDEPPPLLAPFYQPIDIPKAQMPAGTVFSPPTKVVGKSAALSKVSAATPSATGSRAPTGKESGSQGSGKKSDGGAELLATTRASYRTCPQPPYPPEAMKKKQEGRAMLTVRVNEQGLVDSLSLKVSSGYPLLDAAALHAVKAWKFYPATFAGGRIASTVEVPVRFSLD